MALYNNPYQYSFGVPGQMNQFQQQPVQMPAQSVQQPQQNNSGILWVSGEVGAKSYLVAPGTSVLLMDSESEKFYIKSTDVSGMPQPLRTFEYHEVGSQMPPKQPVQSMDSKYVTRQEYDDLKAKFNAIASRLNSFSEPVRANTAQESAAKEETQMSNPLFNALGGGMPQGNGPMQMMQQFMQFKQNFKGDPKAEVEKMLQSGKISQQQLNQVQQMAGQFQHMLKGMK